MMPEEKPFFAPLFKVYFLKFKNGEQDCEIRPYNHRGWNCKNVYPGRLITLSNGYGKHDRLTLEIRKTMITPYLEMENIPQWHIDAVEEIYGQQDKWLIAYLNKY